MNPIIAALVILACVIVSIGVRLLHRRAQQRYRDLAAKELERMAKLPPPGRTPPHQFWSTKER